MAVKKCQAKVYVQSPHQGVMHMVMASLLIWPTTVAIQAYSEDTFIPLILKLYNRNCIINIGYNKLPLI